jgi:hypothetical protein
VRGGVGGGPGAGGERSDILNFRPAISKISQLKKY